MGEEGKSGSGAERGDRELIEEAARFVQRLGLLTPALLFGETFKPWAWIGSQALHFVAPYAGTIFGQDRVDRYGFLLEDRRNAEVFLNRLEELAREEDAAGKRPPKDRWGSQ